MTRAVYPGTFDPPTLGHLDIVRRAAGVFDALVVGVGNNPEKRPVLSMRERLNLVRSETRDIPNVEVRSFAGLAIDFACAEKASVLLRGVRTVSDFEYETQMAGANRASSGIETVFMTPSTEFEFVSGRFVKELVAMGGDVSRLVTPSVADKLKRKLRGKRARR